MNRIVLAIIIQCILLGSAAAALAQGRNPPPPGREPPRDAAAQTAPQRPPESRPQQLPPPPQEGPEKEWVEQMARQMAESNLPPPQKTGDPRPQYKPVVFQLRSAECMEVAEMLGRIFFKSTVVPLPRTNCIIYAGPEDTLPQVTELLGEVDLPAGDAESYKLTMIAVRNRHVEEVADQVMKMLAGRSVRDVRVAADKGRSVLLIRAPKSVAEMAQSVVDELDLPAGSVTLEFTFFRADLNRKESLSPIPPDLLQVAEELRRFGALELMGRLSTIATEGDKFAVGGNTSGNGQEVQVRGELLRASSDNAVSLKLMARMQLDRQNVPPPPSAEKGEDKGTSGPRPSYELDTSVQTKRGDYVVLGSAPTGWAPGESVILVLHVQQ
jgi:hypothetical protein